MRATRIGTVALSGSGWLFPFHIGVVKQLLDTGLIDTQTQLLGTSGGSLVAAGQACGVQHEQILMAALDIASQLRRKGSGLRDHWGQMGPLVETVMREMLPDDAHIRCAGRLSVAVTPMSGEADRCYPVCP